MKAEKDKFPFLGLHTPENPNEIWLTTTLQLKRNLQNFPFPPTLSEADREKVRTRISSQFKASTLIRAEDLGPLEKEFLYEHALVPDSLQHSGKGQGFLLYNGVFVTINMGDHLQLQVNEMGGAVEKAFHQLVDVEASLTSPLSFSPRFGYLTSNSVECGTAMIGRLYLHVPALIHTQSLSLDAEIEGSSLQGGLEEIAGDILIIRNRCTIGLSEENILEQLRTSALKVMVAERRARKEIAESPEIKDKVARAYGLALHSYQLETLEAWSALSWLKLGLALGFVSGTSHTQINELIFTCRRAHLIAEYGTEISQEELPHRRAEYLHGSLRDANLLRNL